MSLNLKKPTKYKYFFISIIILFVFFQCQIYSQVSASQEKISTTKDTLATIEKEPIKLPQEEINKIETFVKKQMQKGKIPGLSLTIVKQDQTVFQKGFGFADLSKKTPVTPATFFELASCSKAFTGLAILQMAEKGKIRLKDPVEKYIPGLKLKYRGKEVNLTIEHCLYQSTGFQYFETLAVIPESNKTDALETAVYKMNNWELSIPPGTKYTYSSIAYNILGLILQKVSGVSYEEYMKTHIFKPLNLNNTHFIGDDTLKKEMATGYKFYFEEPKAFNAPIFGGNTPSAYIITNAQDLSQWLKIQLRGIEFSESPTTAESTPLLNGITGQLITQSHTPAPHLNSPNYAAGWLIFPKTQLVLHTGLNPNFSSYIAFGPEKLGVAILTNMGTMGTGGIGQGVMSILRGEEPQPSNYDRNRQFDGLSTKIILIGGALLIFNLLLFLFSLFKIVRGKRRFTTRGSKSLFITMIATALFAALIFLILNIPSLMGINIPLFFAFTWAPFSFAYAILTIFLTGLFLYLFILSMIFFKKS